MALRYRVAGLFAVNGRVLTNDDEAEIKALPRDVRDRQIELGNLVEWDDRHGEEPPAAASAAPTATRKSAARAADKE